MLYARPNEETNFAAKFLELLDEPERRARMGELEGRVYNVRLPGNTRL